MPKLGYAKGAPHAQFFTPVFTWRPDNAQDQEPNYVIFNSTFFAAPNPYLATVLGHQADISGFTTVFGLGWGEEWALIEFTSGPFLFSTLTNNGIAPEMSVAIIKGPLLDQQRQVHRTPDVIGDRKSVV